MKSKTNDKLVFSIYLISFIPFLMRSFIPYELLVIVCFIFQVLISFILLLRGNKIDKNSLLFFGFFLLFSIVSLFCYLLGIKNGNQDIFGLIISILFYFVFVLILPMTRLNLYQIQKLQKMINLLGLFAIIVNFVQVILSPPNISNIGSIYSINYTSFFINRNSYGQFLFFLIIINIFMDIYYDQNIVYQKYKSGFINHVYFLSILLTFSRGAILASSIVMIFRYYRKKYKAIIALVIITVLLFMIFDSSNNVLEVLDKIFIRSELGTNSRSMIWKFGIEMFLSNNIFFGIGKYSARDLLLTHGFNVGEFHNMFIEILLSGGFFEFTIYIILGVVLYRKYKVNSFPRYVLLSVAIYAFFESVSVFTIGHVGTQMSFVVISLPLMLIKNKNVNLVS